MSEISEAIQEIYIKEALAHPAQPINITAPSMRQPIKDHGSLRAADKKSMAHPEGAQAL